MNDCIAICAGICIVEGNALAILLHLLTEPPTVFPMTYDAKVVPKSDNEDYCSSEQSERDIEQILADVRALVDDYLTRPSTVGPTEDSDNRES